MIACLTDADCGPSTCIWITPQSDGIHLPVSHRYVWSGVLSRESTEAHHVRDIYIWCVAGFLLSFQCTCADSSTRGNYVCMYMYVCVASLQTSTYDVLQDFLYHSCVFEQTAVQEIEVCFEGVMICMLTCLSDCKCEVMDCLCLLWDIHS